MADCFIRTFDPDNDPDYVLTKTDILIQLRSDFTHSEFQFSARYRGVSASATMQDDCRCFRFKMIDYNKHPLRWKTQIVPLTDEQEDAIMQTAMKMAGLLGNLTAAHIVFSESATMGQIFKGPNALKYDLIGVSLSFILPKWRVVRPHKRWVWCSEGVTILLQVVYYDFNGRADEQSPETLFYEWSKYHGKAA